MKATFVDFDDSFSYNVVQSLQEAGLGVEVINWRDLEVLPESGLLVLGPGPGHPDEYQRLFPLLQEWLKEERPFLGICLGHQIFWRLQGERVLRSKRPMHGQRLRLELAQSWREWLELPPAEEVWVQRYNSLAVLEEAARRSPHLLNFVQDEEVLITRGVKLITYQFHPESVGTSCQRAFLGPVVRDLV